MSVAGLKARVQKDVCTACGRCEKICPVGAISTVSKGIATVHEPACIGCMRCLRACPASAIKAG